MLGSFQKAIDRWVWYKEAPKASGLRDPEGDHSATNEGMHEGEEKNITDDQGQHGEEHHERLDGEEAGRSNIPGTLRTTTSVPPVLASTTAAASTATVAGTSCAARQPAAMECDKEDGDL